jgi:tripartite-type tricarboxylate transporter receptor subunit TctC
LKGYELTFWFAAYVPAKTSPAIVSRLNGLFGNATRAAPAQKFFASTGIEPYVMSPAELARFQAAESAKWAKVIKAAGIEPE